MPGMHVSSHEESAVDPPQLGPRASGGILLLPCGVAFRSLSARPAHALFIGSRQRICPPRGIAQVARLPRRQFLLGPERRTTARKAAQRGAAAVRTRAVVIQRQSSRHKLSRVSAQRHCAARRSPSGSDIGARALTPQNRWCGAAALQGGSGRQPGFAWILSRLGPVRSGASWAQRERLRIAVVRAQGCLG